MTAAYRVSIDRARCGSCGSCENLLPDHLAPFLRGRLLSAEDLASYGHIIEAAMANCSLNAIHLEDAHEDRSEHRT